MKKEEERKQELSYEALQSRATVASYLRAIADGLESGTLSLRGEETSLELHPQRLIGFELDARQQRGRARVRVRLAWRQDDPSGGDSLTISSSQ